MKRGPTPGIRPRRLNPPWMPLDCGVISVSFTRRIQASP
jgi:hypothetical protein